jgi:hypothetical protein
VICRQSEESKQMTTPPQALLSSFEQLHHLSYLSVAEGRLDGEPPTSFGLRCGWHSFASLPGSRFFVRCSTNRRTIETGAGITPNGDAVPRTEGRR